MSDRRILLFALALIGRPLAAQDDIAQLRRHVASIEAHRVVLARAVARQDSAVLEAQALRVVGSAPFEVSVPSAAAAGAAEVVAKVVAVQRARFGSLLDRLPPETLTVAFEPVAMKNGKGMEIETPAHLVDRLEWVIGNRIGARVVLRLPEGLFPWMGGRFPAGNGEGERVRALNALLSDSTGRGIQCLEGEIATCRALLTGRANGAGDLALSLVGSVIEQGGVEAWGRIAAGGGTIEDALTRGAGAPIDTVVVRWVAALHTRGVDAAPPLGVLLPSAVIWAVLLAALFLWRVKWHHV